MIKPIKALAVVKRAKPVLNANGIFHKADRKFIIIGNHEDLIDVTITPIAKKDTTKARNKPAKEKRIQKKRFIKISKDYFKDLEWKTEVKVEAPKKKVSGKAKKGAR